MRTVLSIMLNIAIYAGIVVGIVWGIPAYLSHKLGTEHPMASITSSSMWPALKAGDLVFIEAIAKDELGIGDIIVWQGDGMFTIHRIVKLDDTTLTTKGDANFENDAPIPYSAVVGRAAMKKSGRPWRIPYAGLLANVGMSVRTVSFDRALEYERK